MNRGLWRGIVTIQQVAAITGEAELDFVACHHRRRDDDQTALGLGLAVAGDVVVIAAAGSVLGTSIVVTDERPGAAQSVGTILPVREGPDRHGPNMGGRGGDVGKTPRVELILKLEID